MPLNTAGNLGEDPPDELPKKVISGYEKRVDDILAAFIADGIVSNTEYHTLSIGKKVIDNFINTLLGNAISQRQKQYIVEHGIASDVNFQILMMEVGMHNILTGEPERFLQHLLENPEIFHSRDYILQDPEIQSVLQKRLVFLENNNQRGFVGMIRGIFISSDTLE